MRGDGRRSAVGSVPAVSVTLDDVRTQLDPVCPHDGPAPLDTTTVLIAPESFDQDDGDIGADVQVRALLARRHRGADRLAALDDVHAAEGGVPA